MSPMGPSRALILKYSLVFVVVVALQQQSNYHEYAKNLISQAGSKF